MAARHTFATLLLLAAAFSFPIARADSPSSDAASDESVAVPDLDFVVVGPAGEACVGAFVLVWDAAPRPGELLMESRFDDDAPAFDVGWDEWCAYMQRRYAEAIVGRTDESGRFVGSLPEAATGYVLPRVSVRPGPYRNATRVVQPGLPVRARIVAGPPEVETQSVRVLDPSGQPLAGAKCWVVGENADSETGEPREPFPAWDEWLDWNPAVTNTAGVAQAIFESRYLTEYGSVVVDHPSYPLAKSEVHEAARFGSGATIEVVLPAAPIATVRVTDPDGEPCKGVFVHLGEPTEWDPESDDWPGPEVDWLYRVVLTDADGVARVPLIEEATHLLISSRAYGGEAMVELPAELLPATDSEPLAYEVVLPPSQAVFEATIYDPQGRLVDTIDGLHEVDARLFGTKRGRAFGVIDLWSIAITPDAVKPRPSSITYSPAQGTTMFDHLPGYQGVMPSAPSRVRFEAGWRDRHAMPQRVQIIASHPEWGMAAGTIVEQPERGGHYRCEIRFSGEPIGIDDLGGGWLLRGRVVDEQGEPVAGALVQGTEDPSWYFTPRTNSQGRFALPMPDAPYDGDPETAEFRVGKAGYRHGVITVDDWPDEGGERERDVAIELEPLPRIVGRVEMDDRSAWPELLRIHAIELRTGSRWDSEPLEHFDPATGEFEVSLPPGNRSSQLGFVAMWPNGTVLSRTFHIDPDRTADAPPRVLRPPAPVRLRGTITDESGNVVEDATVLISRSNEQDLSPYERDAHAVCVDRETGAFDLGPIAYRVHYHLHIQWSGGQTMRGVRFDAGGEERELAIVVDRGGSD